MEETYELPSFIYSTGFIVAVLALALIQIAGMWKVFTKAGQPGWAALIPIYNIYVLCKVGGKPGWWVILCIFIPFFIIWPYNMVSKSFGHDEGFTFGLLILGVIFWPILGFGSSKYLGPYGDPAAFRAYQEKNKFDFENRQ